ncbi:MAG: hypothetical protein AAFR79_20130, partial [Pseudomonadota bacterium]
MEPRSTTFYVLAVFFGLFLLFLYGPALWSRYPVTGRGMVIGGVILTASITFRSVDEMVCEAFPL